MIGRVACSAGLIGAFFFTQADVLAQTEKERTDAAAAAAALKELAKPTSRIDDDNRHYALRFWPTKVNEHVRNRLVLPADVPASASAEFYVALLPSGQVDYVQLASSSGDKAFNAAVEKAIKAASPLPKVRADMPYPDHVYVRLKP